MNSLQRVLIVIAAFASASVWADQADVLRDVQTDFATSEASAEMITAKVNLAEQTMYVYVGDALMYTWPVSTARSGYKTPPGSYAPYLLDKNHHSKIYDNAPMPYSVFFLGNYAVHGTTAIKTLGRRASHGCVRLLTENARTLYMLVQQYGKQNARIIIEA
jgi:lipoprotein-anchoring transpeptidase ErfK/SrfK